MTRRVLTWHVHGSYLYYLAHSNLEFVLPTKPGRPEGYGGRIGPFAWPDNVREVPAERIAEEQFDCVLFQSRRNYLEDQYEILSPIQQQLPRVYLEHDPPRQDPINERHPVDDPGTLLVHVTSFNQLMWDAGRTPTRVIEHGVTVPAHVGYTGELPRGIAVVNNISSRGRRLGADVFASVARRVPVDLVGMASTEAGGLGEVAHASLPAFEARYRFFFNPIRYTSLGLAVCEAMMVGLPIVGLATTEMVTVVEQGVSGYLDTDPAELVERMRGLIADPAEARRLGVAARRQALERFDIRRFCRDWEDTIAEAAGKPNRQFSMAAGGVG